MLNDHIKYLRPEVNAPLVINGIADSATIKAIDIFEIKVQRMPNPDSFVSKNGNTIKKLKGTYWSCSEIPSTINGVTVEFKSDVNRNVHPDIIDGLKHCIKKDVASDYTLNKILISSAFDGADHPSTPHRYPSRHIQLKAVDISRINGIKMSEGYNRNDVVTKIVDAIQDRFETFVGRRENFGPHIKHKSGKYYWVKGHQDHIHLSVD